MYKLNWRNFFGRKTKTQKLKSLFKDAKRNAEELQLNCQFNEEGRSHRVIRHADQVAVISTKEPRNIREIVRKITKEKRRTEVMEQPWMGKYVNHHWKDPEIAPMSYHKFKSWKNIPDIVLSIDTSIRQQLVNNKTCRKEKLQESVKETNYRVCDNDQETVPHILCGCSQMAQTLYKDRHDKTRRPLYYNKTGLVHAGERLRNLWTIDRAANDWTVWP